MEVETIRESIRAWLKARKLRFSQFEGGSIQCLFRGKETGFSITFGSISERGFSVMASTGMYVPERFRREAYEHACRMNYKRLSTTLEIDPEDGEWRVRVYIPLMGTSRVPRSQLDWALSVVRNELLENLKPLREGRFDSSEEDEVELVEEDPWEIQDEELRRIVEGEE